jgi:hypothetical protein
MAPMHHDGQFEYEFKAADCREPAHVHLRYRESVAKFWIHKTRPELASGKPSSTGDLRKMLAWVSRRQARLLNEWEEFCNGRG